MLGVLAKIRKVLLWVQAVEFVTMQHDDELWEELIKQCLHKPEMVHFGLVLLIAVLLQTSVIQHVHMFIEFTSLFCNMAGGGIVGAHCWQS